MLVDFLVVGGDVFGPDGNIIAYLDLLKDGVPGLLIEVAVLVLIVLGAPGVLMTIDTVLNLHR